MNYFVEGLQGSGKSTMVQRLSGELPEYKVYREGDYSPVELAWCAYVTEEKYREILDRYPMLRTEIEAKTTMEGDHRVICYTQIITDVPGFHKDLEQYEIYNRGHESEEEFRRIILSRYSRWNGENEIFECSLMQNIVEDMILFKCASDDEILDFYHQVKQALAGRTYRIIYLKAEDIQGNLDVIRKERSDDQGNELWFPLMMGYFDRSPYAKAKGVSGEKALVEHFIHRQELELRICREIFPEEAMILESKQYDIHNVIGQVETE